jgi:dipeptidyl aminopeptidase/acylaminoacyl peptidase
VYTFEPAQPGPHPVLIWLQGGVEAAFRPDFDPWIQFVVHELGFAVVAPSLRGSAGLGKSFAALADGPSREDAVKDLGALVVWIGGQSSLDAKHIVVAGVGYGGYLATAALATYGDRLRAGIDVRGITDFVDLLGDPSSAFLQAERRADFGDERDPDVRAYLRRISPLTNAERITKPLLVVHGKNDPSIPIDQSESLVSRLQSRGAPVAYMIATREGQDLQRESDRAAWFRATAAFLTTLP